MRDPTTAGPSPPSGWMRSCSPWSSSATAPPWDRASRADPSSSATWRPWSGRPPSWSLRAPTLAGRSAAGALQPLVAAGVRVQRCWDVAEVHRLLHGGWRADLARVWASAHGLDPERAPKPAGDDLFDLLDGGSAAGGTDRPRCRGPPRRLPAPGRPRPVLGDVGEPVPGRRRGPDRAGRPPGAAAERARTAGGRRRILRVRRGRPVPGARTRRAAGGPPGRRGAHRRLRRPAARRREGRRADPPRARRPGPGPRPRPRGHRPAQPGAGEGPARRGGRLGAEHPQVRAGAVPPDASAGGRAAGVAQGGADRDDLRVPLARRARRPGRPSARRLDGLRRCGGPDDRPERPAQPARPAATGGRRRARHVFVRADLGQIEPRVLAVVSGDRAFAEATRADDLYAPVAAKLGIERRWPRWPSSPRCTGSAPGAAGRALGDLERAYPVAMGLLDEAYASGVARRPLRTFGGRRINLDAAGRAATTAGGAGSHGTR